MLHSREFIAGLASMGISQFLWTLARIVLLVGASEWVLGTMGGIYLAATVVTILTAVATAPTSKWVVAILYGLGLLLPPLAVGAVAGEVIRKLRRPRRSASR